MAGQRRHEVERVTRRIVFMLPPSLFAEFEQWCEAQHKTVSDGLRELVVTFVLDKK